MFNKSDNHHSLLHGQMLPQTTIKCAPLHCCCATYWPFPVPLLLLFICYKQKCCSGMLPSALKCKLNFYDCNAVDDSTLWLHGHWCPLWSEPPRLRTKVRQMQRVYICQLRVTSDSYTLGGPVRLFQWFSFPKVTVHSSYC